MPTAAEMLWELRQRDEHNIGIATMLSMDIALTRLVAAWPNVGRRLRPDENPDEKVPPSIPIEERELWLWSRVEPEPEPLWAQAAGLPDAPHVRRFMQTLKDIGAVFPDGSMSQWAAKFLQAQAKRVGVVQPEAAAE